LARPGVAKTLMGLGAGHFKKKRRQFLRKLKMARNARAGRQDSPKAWGALRWIGGEYKRKRQEVKDNAKSAKKEFIFRATRFSWFREGTG